MRPSTLKKSKEAIIGFFEKSHINIFSVNALSEIMNNNRQHWKLAEYLGVGHFIEFLKEEGRLFSIEIAFTNNGSLVNQYQRFVWEKANVWGVMQSIYPKGYFSHIAAVYLLGLTEQVPKKLFIKNEVLAPGSGDKAAATLNQANINKAFKLPARKSNTQATYDIYTVYYLVGEKTDDLGITKAIIEGTEVRTTNLERTLIDIAVRPQYFGGANEIVNIYRKAASKVSINKLQSILKRLNYKYPYQQVIGFYMEKAGNYTDFQLGIIERMGTPYDFYLTNQIQLTDYSSRWRLYYPKGL